MSRTIRSCITLPLLLTLSIPVLGQRRPSPYYEDTNNVPNSPEIHADRTVTFRLLAPKALDVTLNGSWDGATNLKMTKDEAGIWSTTIGPLAPQLWGYWFMVDGVKALDPNNADLLARKKQASERQPQASAAGQ